MMNRSFKFTKLESDLDLFYFALTARLPSSCLSPFRSISFLFFLSSFIPSFFLPSLPLLHSIGVYSYTKVSLILMLRDMNFRGRTTFNGSNFFFVCFAHLKNCPFHFLVFKKTDNKTKENKSLPHHMVIGTRALLALKWLVWR